MIVFGKLKEARSVKTKNGTGTILDITRPGKWDPAKKQFGPEETIGVWYFNSKGGQFADWALERQKDVGKNVLLSARVTSNDGKESYFGNRLPVTYGVIHDPARCKENPTEDEINAAIMAVEDCHDAEELPNDMEVEFDDAECITNVVTVLRASNSSVATSAVAALSALIYPETNAYLGRIGSKDKYGNVVKVSFATPNTTPTEWNNVSFFGATAERADKVLKKGDNVVLILSAKGSYNGKPDYRGINFTKLQ